MTVDFDEVPIDEVQVDCPHCNAPKKSSHTIPNVEEVTELGQKTIEQTKVEKTTFAFSNEEPSLQGKVTAAPEGSENIPPLNKLRQGASKRKDAPGSLFDLAKEPPTKKIKNVNPTLELIKAYNKKEKISNIEGQKKIAENKTIFQQMQDLQKVFSELEANIHDSPKEMSFEDPKFAKALAVLEEKEIIPEGKRIFKLSECKKLCGEVGLLLRILPEQASQNAMEAQQILSALTELVSGLQKALEGQDSFIRSINRNSIR